jgi:hypothetical protein
MVVTRPWHPAGRQNYCDTKPFKFKELLVSLKGRRVEEK